MLCTFPPKTHIVEAHTRTPLVHFFPPGRLRQRLLTLSHQVLKTPPDDHPTDPVGVRWDRYLEEKVIYRSQRQVEALFRASFESVESDQKAYAEAIAGTGPWATTVGWVLQRVHNATYVLSKPIHPSRG